MYRNRAYRPSLTSSGRNLPRDVTSGGLQDICRGCLRAWWYTVLCFLCTAHRVPTDRGGKPKGYGFVVYATERDAADTIL